MIFKDKTVFDKDLLDTYKLKPCILTGEMGTHAQHRCKRSKLRLDIPENLEPVNDYINGLLLLSLPCFIEEMNKDYGNRKEEMIATFNRNTGKKYSTWHQIWSYLTDEDEEIYKRYRKCVLLINQSLRAISR